MSTTTALARPLRQRPFPRPSFDWKPVALLATVMLLALPPWAAAAPGSR
jgi:hypothetical protein